MAHCGRMAVPRHEQGREAQGTGREQELSLLFSMVQIVRWVRECSTGAPPAYICENGVQTGETTAADQALVSRKLGMPLLLDATQFGSRAVVVEVLDGKREKDTSTVHRG